jgi:Mor family transcriptional regulator
MGKKRHLNAQHVLPEHLVKEIQKYVQAQNLYIPSAEKEEWGSGTGIREELKERNHRIYELHSGGISVHELSHIYQLSEERVRNIIYDYGKGRNRE